MNTLTHRQHFGQKRAGAVYSGMLIAFLSVLVFVISSDVLSIVSDKNPAAAQIKVFLLLPLGLFVLLYFSKLLRGVMALPEIPLLAVLALGSFVWSYQPLLTIERAVPLVITTLVSVTIASIFSLRKLIIVFGFIGALAMIVSLLAIAAIPGARGIPPWDETWNGVYNHKNALGANSVLAMIFTFGATTVTSGFMRRFFQFSFVLAVVLLIASESRSSQIVAVLSIMAVSTYFLMKRLALIWAFGYLFVIIVFLGLTGYLLSTEVLAPIFEAVNRKPTLSGRLPLWSLMGPYMREEFWLGYGYLAFWDPTSFRVMQLSSRLGLGFSPFYSHNGLIETWLHLGAVGFVILIIALMRIGRACFTILRQRTDRTAMISVILVLIAFVLMNTTESSVLSRTSLTWMAFVAFGTKACLLASIVNTQPGLSRIRAQRPQAPTTVEG